MHNATTQPDTTTPQRSLEQRQAALDRANEIRKFRAQLKRDIKAGRKCAVDLLTDPPAEVETMKVFEVLLALPKVGRTKAGKLLNVVRASPSKTIGGLSARQRNELVTLLAAR